MKNKDLGQIKAFVNLKNVKVVIFKKFQNMSHF